MSLDCLNIILYSVTIIIFGGMIFYATYKYRQAEFNPILYKAALVFVYIGVVLNVFELYRAGLWLHATGEVLFLQMALSGIFITSKWFSKFKVAYIFIFLFLTICFILLSIKEKNYPSAYFGALFIIYLPVLFFIKRPKPKVI